MVVASSGDMGRRLVWAGVAAVTLGAAVVVLRDPAPAPPPPAPVRAQKVLGDVRDWRWTPSAGDVRRTFVDGDRTYVADGVIGSRTVDRTADVLSTVDHGVARSSAGHPAAGPFVVTPKALVLQDGVRCLEVVDPATLARRARHCAAENAEISLLSAEPEGAQWRETAQGVECASWYRLGDDGVPQRIPVGDEACRSALLVHAGGWELTADFPPYQMGVAHPGPLLARKGDREIVLDASAVDIRACGGAVHWVSGAEPRAVVSWRPGETEVTATGLAGAQSLRCVNGTVNVVAPAGVFHPEQR